MYAFMHLNQKCMFKELCEKEAGEVCFRMSRCEILDGICGNNSLSIRQPLVAWFPQPGISWPSALPQKSVTALKVNSIGGS